MFSGHLRTIRSRTNFGTRLSPTKSFALGNVELQSSKFQESVREDVSPSFEKPVGELFPTNRDIPMIVSNKEPVVLPFDDIPGPKALKYLANVRNYLSEVGTQLTAGALTVGLNISTLVNSQKPLKNLSSLFDQYGPVVRFVSPVGGDIVLLNHPDHIQKVFLTEGDYPVRSALDSLEKYRNEHRQQIFGGIYTMQGADWARQRATVLGPLQSSVTEHALGLRDVCESFCQKIYNIRNQQDEVAQDLYREIHKWAFDSMGLIMFSKKFTMIDTDMVYSQCDMSWMYYSLEKATEAILKCESGLQLWKIIGTPAWYSLIKYCNSLDSLIGKHVMEAEQAIAFRTKDGEILPTTASTSLIDAMLLGEDKMSTEDIATILMDMLVIGVNTVASSMSFLLFHLAKHQRAQRQLHAELTGVDVTSRLTSDQLPRLRDSTPFLQACIKESMRLVPPIPVLTRVLSKNITLDKYNIPRGTLIIMSTRDTALKEQNYDEAATFQPERWLRSDAKDYHAFASVPFGHGPRKCLGQNIAETMMSMLTIKLLQKYKLEYHYGEIIPTRTFIAKPSKQLKIRFVDRTV